MIWKWKLSKRKAFLSATATAALSLGACRAWVDEGSTSIHVRETGNGYADPDTCLSCHSGIAVTYLQTGMA